MTLTKRMALGFAALIFAVAVLVSLNGSELLWIRATETWIEEQEQRANTANQMMSLVNSMDEDISYVNQAVSQGAAVAQLQESFYADADTLADLVETASRSTEPGSTDRSTLQEIALVLTRCRQAASTLFTAVDQESAQVKEHLAVTTSLSIQLGETTAPYVENTLALLDAKQARLGYIASVCLIITSIIGAVAFVGGIVMSWLLTRRIKGTLRAAVTDIGSSTAQLLTAAAQASASASQTAASTTETTATAEEVKQAAALSQEKATEIADSADDVARISEAGQTMVRGTNDSIEVMRGKTDLVYETVERLNERARAVDDIIAAVNDLAEQSNLLSVNASIEAAKAGESGRGFTVVAQEVKNLAEQSKQATAQARLILGEIRKASGVAVQATQDSRDAIDMGRRQSLEAGEVIQKLADRALEVAHAQAQIAASSRQQLAGIEQIVKAIENIDQASDHSVEGSQQVDKAIEHLQELSARLRHLTDTASTH